jgi:hypothetical protein
MVHTIRQANRAEQIPIFAMGVGFDANMDLLKDITDRTPGANLKNSTTVNYHGNFNPTNSRVKILR